MVEGGVWVWLVGWECGFWDEWMVLCCVVLGAARVEWKGKKGGWVLLRRYAV